MDIPVKIKHVFNFKCKIYLLISKVYFTFGLINLTL